jgi:glycosyltransferase involved in cell wall biosynthesis
LEWQPLSGKTGAKMKVAYFTESLPPNTDGVGRTMCHLTQTLDSEKIEYRFLSPFKPDHSTPWSRNVHKIGSVPFLLYKDYRVGVPDLPRISRLLDRFSPDLIHITSPTPLGIYGIQYAKKRKIKVVASYHTNFTDYFSYYGFGKVEKAGWEYLKWFYNSCDRTFAVSPSSVTRLKERGFKNVELWMHGVELAQFSPKYRMNELRRKVAAENRPILLFVGRLVKEKGLDILIAADRILRGKRHDFQLVFVGEGPMRSELQEKLPNACFTGTLHGVRLSEWYASADLFVFPSKTETLGNVIIEAFASGVPAVCVGRGGALDIVDHGRNGFLAKPDDPADFADAIEIFLRNRLLFRKMGSAAEKSVFRFDHHPNNKLLLDSYRKLILN